MPYIDDPVEEQPVAPVSSNRVTTNPSGIDFSFFPKDTSNIPNAAIKALSPGVARQIADQFDPEKWEQDKAALMNQGLSEDQANAVLDEEYGESRRMKEAFDRDEMEAAQEQEQQDLAAQAEQERLQRRQASIEALIDQGLTPEMAERAADIAEDNAVAGEVAADPSITSDDLEPPGMPQAPSGESTMPQGYQFAGIDAPQMSTPDALAQYEQTLKGLPEQKNQLEQQQLQDIEAIQDESGQRVASLQEKLSTIEANSDQIIEQINSTKINPNRYVENMSTTQKVFGILAAGFQGFGGSDSYLRGLDKAIRNDVEAQEANLNKLGTVAKGYAEAKDLVRLAIKDEKAATNIRIAAEYKKHANQLDSLYAQADTQFKQARIAQMKDQLLVKEMEYKQKANQQLGRSYILASIKDATSAGRTLSPSDIRLALPSFKDVLGTDKQFNAAADELTKYTLASSHAEEAGKAFDEYWDKYGSPVLNNPLGAAQADVEGLNANMFKFIKDAMGERMTDYDAKMLVVPFNLTRADLSRERMEVKKAQLKKLIMKNASTPILRSIGLVPSDDNKNDIQALGARKAK